MPNKYSHALVLSNYEARGIIDLHNHPRRPPPATTPVTADSTQHQQPQRPPPVTEGPPTLPADEMRRTRTSTSTPRSVVVSKHTPQTTSAPLRAVFEDSPPTTPDPPDFRSGYKHGAAASTVNRRSSIDKRPPPDTTLPPTSSRGYRHIPSATPIPPHSALDDKQNAQPRTTPLHSTAVLKELPQDQRIQNQATVELAAARPNRTAPPKVSSNLKELPRDTRTQKRVSLDLASARPDIKTPDYSSSVLTEIPRNAPSPPILSLHSNYIPIINASTPTQRPQTADATPATTSPSPLRPRTLANSPSSQSSRSSHHTVDSIITQIFAPEPLSPPPTPPRSSASFETAIFAPEPAFLPDTVRRESPTKPRSEPVSPTRIIPRREPVSPPKVESRREPPAIPPRSSSIPRPSSSSVHHPDFDTFSSVNLSTMSSATSTFTSTTSSFHQTPRTSYSHNTSSLPSKSPERGEPCFNPDRAPAPDPENVPFPKESTVQPWEAPDEFQSFFRPSISSDQYDLEAATSRSSSLDEAAPPPISLVPRGRSFHPVAMTTTTVKKPRRLSFTHLRPDCEAIAYDQTRPGRAPIPIATAKDPRIQPKSNANKLKMREGRREEIEREGKGTGKRMSWGGVGRAMVRDPFEVRGRKGGFSRGLI